MLMFTLAISCLTTYSLPWFMDLTFQVPMQHCSLHHQTLFLSPATPTTGCYFCFDSISSFFFFFRVISPHFSSSILGTYRPGEFIFQCPIFLPFHTSHGVLKARILNGLPFPSPVLQSMVSQRMGLSDWTELWRGGAMEGYKEKGPWGGT